MFPDQKPTPVHATAELGRSLRTRRPPPLPIVRRSHGDCTPRHATDKRERVNTPSTTQQCPVSRSQGTSSGASHQIASQVCDGPKLNANATSPQQTFLAAPHGSFSCCQTCKPNSCDRLNMSYNAAVFAAPERSQQEGGNPEIPTHALIAMRRLIIGRQI